MTSLPRALASAASLFCVTACANADLARVPVVQRWPAPDGSATVVWEGAATRDGNPDRYALVLENRNRVPVVLTSFGRGVDVDWSPDSKHLAVTDHVGSNIAECFVLDISAPLAQSSINAALPALPETSESAHLYVECHGWLDAGHVIVGVFSHTDFYPSKDFAYRFIYDLADQRMDALP